MSLLALRKRRMATGEPPAPAEMLRPMGMGLLGATMGGVMGAKKPMMTLGVGMLALGLGAYKQNPMLQMAGATMLAGVVSDATNFMENYAADANTRRAEPPGAKEKLKAYTEHIKSPMALKAKEETPPEATEGELAGIREEFAALDRIESGLLQNAPEPSPAIF